MKRAAFLTALFLMIVVFLFISPMLAQAKERILPVSASITRLHSGKELGVTMAGELVVCGSSLQRNKSCMANKDTRAQIILWDERGPLRKPSQSVSGVTQNATTAKTMLRMSHSALG